ncbi:MAG TPA: non-canonical purine NTP diphosphatase [Bacteroidales bacterium]
MKTLVFATNNKHKLEEVSSLTARGFHIVSLDEIGCTKDIPETEPTLEGNALLKARYVHSRYGHDCFADDTGLEIDALDGRPGVYSARYSGKEHDFEANMDKVLGELKGIINRKAQFRTVIALIMYGKEYLFEGIVKGNMLTERHGAEGFGYDPIFQPEGCKHTFAEMTLEEKNTMSHRARAVSKLAEFLQERVVKET